MNTGNNKKYVTDINKISDFFLSKRALTPKKLQKLVYYAYAWYITLYNDDVNSINTMLFNECPEAWVHGPVFRSLYSKYKDYYWKTIPKNEKKYKFENSELEEFLNKIWKTFMLYSADELEFMTHQESPWKNAREGLEPFDASNKKIDSKDIFIFYNKLANE